MVDHRSSMGDPPIDHQRLLEQVPGVVFALDARGGARYVSPQAERILGRPAEAWTADPFLWTRALHPDDRDRVVEGWRRAAGSGQPFRAEYRMLRPDGTAVWIREHTDPVRDAAGAIVGWQGLSIDVTETHLAQADRTTTDARYRALVEQLPAVVYVDSDEVHPRSLYVSPNAEALLGYPPEAYLADPALWRRTIHDDDRERVLAAWAEAIRTGSPFHEDYRFVRPDGGIVWVRDTSLRIRAADGRSQWQGVILDVTTQVLAEQEVRASTARYRALVESIPAVVYEMGPDDERRTLYVSPHIETLLGYSRQEWLDQPDIWIELLHPDDREYELAAHDHHTETGEPWRREYRLIAADGRIVWVRDQAVLVRDERGRPQTWQGVLVDITGPKELEEQLRTANEELEFRVRARTAQLQEANELMGLEIAERRRMERELRDAQERYRRLVEDVPAVVYRWQVRPSSSTDHTYVSPQIEPMLGYTPAEWHPRRGVWRERLHPHDRDRVIAAAERSERTGEPFQQEYRYLAKDGRVVWVADRATLLARDDDGRPLVFQGVMVDATARHEAERKAAEVEARFRELAEESPVSPWAAEISYGTTPPTLRIDYVGPRIAEALGVAPTSWAGDRSRWLEMVHPDDRTWVGELATQNLSSGQSWDVCYRMLAANGSVVWVNDRGRCVARDTQGRPTRFVGTIADVTAWRAAETERARALDAMRSLVEQMPAIAWTELVDPTSGWRRFAYIGPQARELLGYEPEELIAEPDHFARMLHPADRDRVLRGAWVADRSADTWSDRFRVRRRDGAIRWFYSTARRVTPKDEVPAIWQGICVDVTDVLPVPVEETTIRLTEPSPVEPTA